MFTLDDVKEFLENLKLPINDENIKWAYKIMLSEIKTLVKMRKFEKKYKESVFDDLEGDCCCDNDCDCKECCCNK